MNTPLVSIVVNNYNYDRFLREAIDSALNQTYPLKEVIVVDDGSTDGSREIIAGYGDRVVPILKENGGQASTFNVGFRASRGEVVFFLDADDYFLPGAVEQVVEAMGQGVAKVHFRRRTVDAYGNPMGFEPPPNISLDEGEVWRLLLERGNYVTVGTSGNGFGREALEQTLPMSETEFAISADAYLKYTVPFHGRVVALERTLGAYRIHGSNRWASGRSISGDRLLARLRFDLLAQKLLIQKAGELGHDVPPDVGLRDYGNLLRRIAVLRLIPRQHPVTSDSLPGLVYQGLRAVWQYSNLNWKRRFIYSAWFASTGLLPAPVAKPAVIWMFAPQSRPGVLEWLRGRIRF